MWPHSSFPSTVHSVAIYLTRYEGDVRHPQELQRQMKSYINDVPNIYHDVTNVWYNAL